MLGSFLRKNQRALKLGTLACLTSLVTHHSASIKPAALEPVLSELPALVDESDMHVSQVLDLTPALINQAPSTVLTVTFREYMMANIDEESGDLVKGRYYLKEWQPGRK